MSKIKIFFDTNVLSYAHDETANYHLESALLLKMSFERQIQGVIGEQRKFWQSYNMLNPNITIPTTFKVSHQQFLELAIINRDLRLERAATVHVNRYAPDWKRDWQP